MLVLIPNLMLDLIYDAWTRFFKLLARRDLLYGFYAFRADPLTMAHIKLEMKLENWDWSNWSEFKFFRKSTFELAIAPHKQLGFLCVLIKLLDRAPSRCVSPEIFISWLGRLERKMNHSLIWIYASRPQNRFWNASDSNNWSFKKVCSLTTAEGCLQLSRVSPDFWIYCVIHTVYLCIHRSIQIMPIKHRCHLRKPLFHLWV